MILKLLLLLALILFPFGELFRFEIGNNVVIKPLDVVVGVTALWWVFTVIKKSGMRFLDFARNDNYWKGYFLPMFLFASIGFVSLLLNLTWLTPNQFFVSFLYLLRFVSYTLLIPIVCGLEQEFKKKISWILFVDGLLILVFGYLQYFFYNSLKGLYHLGWDEHMHRMFSTFFDPNFAGAFFVLYLLFVGGMLIKNHESRIINQGILFIIIFLTLLAVFLTFSRSALLMLTVGAITFLLLINKKKFLLLLFIIIALFALIVSPKFGDENMNLLRETSSKARLANYEVAWQVFLDYPIMGVGFNSYRYTKQLYGLDHDWTDAPSHADAGVDNSWLFVLATTGVIGFFAYSLFWYRLLQRASVVFIASAIALFVNAFFINSLFFAPLLFWMWILVGLKEKE